MNRTPPRTQAALLEAMQEAAATIDGARYRISPVFTVLATQNPVEFEGTYPLPEAQRDRFLMKIVDRLPDARRTRAACSRPTRPAAGCTTRWWPRWSRC